MTVNELRGFQKPFVVYVRPDVYDDLEVIRGSTKRSTFVQDLIVKEIRNAK